MATYVVGDLQGWLTPLEKLLASVKFNLDKDKLWVVGDMVNRGPESLESLRYLYYLRDNLEVVLGNHDLHLLAVAAGYKKASSSDTLSEILSAPDRDVLLDWVRQQKLIHHDKALGYTMVHAGIPPQWSVKKAIKRAQEVESVLRSDQVLEYLSHLYGNEPSQWHKKLKGYDRLRVITNYFTRMRFCTQEGELELSTKLPASAKVAEDLLPWFAHKKRRAADEKIVFGHWAALEGVTKTKNVFALDTGYVWGGALTLMRLEDKKRFVLKR